MQVQVLPTAIRRKAATKWRRPTASNDYNLNHSGGGFDGGWGYSAQRGRLTSEGFWTPYPTLQPSATQEPATITIEDLEAMMRNQFNTTRIVSMLICDVCRFALPSHADEIEKDRQAAKEKCPHCGAKGPMREVTREDWKNRNVRYTLAKPPGVVKQVAS